MKRTLFLLLSGLFILLANFRANSQNGQNVTIPYRAADLIDARLDYCEKVDVAYRNAKTLIEAFKGATSQRDTVIARRAELLGIYRQRSNLQETQIRDLLLQVKKAEKVNARTRKGRVWYFVTGAALGLATIFLIQK